MVPSGITVHVGFPPVSFFDGEQVSASRVGIVGKPHKRGAKRTQVDTHTHTLARCHKGIASWTSLFLQEVLVWSRDTPLSPPSVLWWTTCLRKRLLVCHAKLLPKTATAEATAAAQWTAARWKCSSRKKESNWRKKRERERTRHQPSVMDTEAGSTPPAQRNLTVTLWLMKVRTRCVCVYECGKKKLVVCANKRKMASLWKDCVDICFDLTSCGKGLLVVRSSLFSSCSSFRKIAFC